jgi:hypothetical protein
MIRLVHYDSELHVIWYSLVHIPDLTTEWTPVTFHIPEVPRSVLYPKARYSLFTQSNGGEMIKQFSKWVITDFVDKLHNL